MISLPKPAKLNRIINDVFQNEKLKTLKNFLHFLVLF